MSTTTTTTTPNAAVAIMGYTWRACLPSKRRLGLLLPCAGIMLLGLLTRAVDRDATEAFTQVANAGIFSIMFPIACLVVGDAVLGAEVRAGTLPFTWLAPVPLRTIVLGRWVVGSAVAAVALATSGAIAAVLAGAPESADEIALALAVGAMAYIALFVLIGCTTRRAAVWSLAVVFFVERLLGGALAGIAQLSPTWESYSVFTGLATGTEQFRRTGIPEGGAAIVRLAIITAVCLVAASWRLGRLRLSGPSD